MYIFLNRRSGSLLHGMMPLTKDLCGVIGKAVSIIIVQCTVEALLTLL